MILAVARLSGDAGKPMPRVPDCASSPAVHSPPLLPRLNRELLRPQAGKCWLRRQQRRGRGLRQSSAKILHSGPVAGTCPQHMTPKCLDIFSTQWEKAYTRGSRVTALLYVT